MSTPTPAMAYAKRRREEESTARDDLRNLIPAEHFHADVEGDGNYNLSTKVMKAAESYIQAQEQGNVAVEEGEAESGKGKAKAKSKIVKLVYDKTKSRASEEARRSEMIRTQHPITAPPSATVSALPEIQQLRQCARRLVAVAEAKAQAAEAEASGMSEEFKAAMEKGSDLMIDLIKVIEQEGWSEEMEEKWEERGESGRGRLGWSREAGSVRECDVVSGRAVLGKRRSSRQPF